MSYHTSLHSPIPPHFHLQRPKSIIVVESPSLTRPGTATSATASAAAPADRTAAAAAAAAVFAAMQHSEEQGEAVVATGPSVTGPPSPTASSPASPVAMTATASAKPAPASPAAASALGAAQRIPHMSKSLSFSSAMAGRFSVVKPSKPSAFSLLLRYKGGSSKGEGSMHGSSTAVTTGESFAASGRAAEAAAAAVAEVEAERAAATAAAVALVGSGASQTSGKAAAGERLVIRVQATSGSAAAAVADIFPASTTAVRAAQAGDDLMRAALPDGSRITGSTSTSIPRGSSGGQPISFAAAIKRKLSSAGSKGMSLFAPAAAAAGAKDEASAVALAAAASAAAGRGGGAGCISAVQAPSMQQLLASPVAGGKASKQKRSSTGRSSRLQSLALGFGKKLSFKGSAGQAVASGAEETSGPPRRTASRLSAAAS